MTARQPNPSINDAPSPSLSDCNIGPIDAVYTWVNGSDPSFIDALTMERVKLDQNSVRNTTRQDFMSDSMHQVMKKWTFSEKCRTRMFPPTNNKHSSRRNSKKQFYYVQSHFIYLECLPSDAEGKLQTCSSAVLEEVLQTVNVTLLHFDFRLVTGSNVDLNLDTKNGTWMAANCIQRFLLYSQEHRRANLGKIPSAATFLLC